jgi:hypothetical protein
LFISKIAHMADKNRGRNDQNEKTSGRRAGHNTLENQRADDKMTQGNKGNQQQGNNGSRQGDGGNRGKRGNTGLG